MPTAVGMAAVLATLATTLFAILLLISRLGTEYSLPDRGDCLILAFGWVVMFLFLATMMLTIVYFERKHPELFKRLKEDKEK